jgi:TetR/AcrR family transcriptional regulator, ethionamide resistance regulator
MATRSATPARSARGRRVARARGDDRERAILETAERLLSERPIQEISVDDLARGAGISRPTFYFYFSSKDAVLLALLDRVVDEARASRGDALDGSGDPRERLRQAISGIYETFRAHRSVMLAADASSSTSEVREVWSSVMAVFVEETAAAIEAERAAGTVPDGMPARDLATALNLMNERVLLGTFAGLEPAVAEEDVVDTLVGVWLGAIYGEPASRDGGAG